MKLSISAVAATVVLAACNPSSSPEPKEKASVAQSSPSPKPSETSPGFKECVRKWYDKLQRLNCLVNKAELGDPEQCRSIPDPDEKIACFDRFAVGLEVAEYEPGPELVFIKSFAISPSRFKQGQKYRTHGIMRCFRFSDQEYRCFYPGLRTTGVIQAAGVDEPEKQILDKYCFTAKRGLDEPRCRFESATFVLESRDVDHMETTYFYVTRRMKLIPVNDPRYPR